MFFEAAKMRLLKDIPHLKHLEVTICVDVIGSSDIALLDIETKFAPVALPSLEVSLNYRSCISHTAFIVNELMPDPSTDRVCFLMLSESSKDLFKLVQVQIYSTTD